MRWFRMHAEVRRDPKIQTLSGNLVKAWLNFMCFACDNNGYLPSTKEMAWELRLTEHKVESDIVALMAAKLIDDRKDGLYMHNWNVRQFQSDCSTERVREHRRNKKETFHGGSKVEEGNGEETPPDNREQNTETEAGAVSDFERELDEVAKRIYERHPTHRRCSVAMIKTKLRIIAKKAPSAERINRLKAIDLNHAAWCQYWAKDGGVYAKALENWLAPTMGRFDEEPPQMPPQESRQNQPRLTF